MQERLLVAKNVNWTLKRLSDDMYKIKASSTSDKPRKKPGIKPKSSKLYKSDLSKLFILKKKYFIRGEIGAENGWGPFQLVNVLLLSSSLSKYSF